MNFAKRLVMVAGAVALAGTFGALLAPKAAHGIVATLVQVVNTSANPVPITGSVTDAENPGHSPLRLSFSLTVRNGFGSLFDNFAAQVPDGKRLVVEYVSVSCFVLSSAGVDVATLDLNVSENTGPNSSVSHAIPLPVTKSVTASLGSNRYFASQLVQLYADGSPIGNLGGSVILTGPAPQNGVTCNFEVSGHTVSLP